jgi:type IV pilus assembly protein PilC
MTHFKFQAKKATGETYTGERDVADRYELYRMIRESGEEVISVEESKVKGKMSFDLSRIKLFGKVKTMDKINFARNLGAMLDAGLPLSRALSVLERQAHNKNFKAVLTDVISEINKGVTFAEGLEKHPKVFAKIFISMVRAGEQSGTLSEALKAIATQLDKAHALERRIKGALIYPAVIVFVMILIGILMFIFVVPTLMKTFSELNVELPLPTRIVLWISNVIQHQGLLVILVLIVVAVAISWWAKTAGGKSALHKLLLKIPVIGALAQEVNAARTSRTLSSLLTAGVNVLESVTITADIIQNVHFKAILVAAVEMIKKGKPMAEVFGDNAKLYPVFFTEMMSVGEETGKTSEMLLGVAKYYEEDVEQKTKDMSTIIEPVLMVFIAAAVGFFAIAMISPMYSLVNVI